MSPVPSAQERAAVSLVAQPPSHTQLLLGEFLTTCVTSELEMTNICRGGLFWVLEFKLAGDVVLFLLTHLAGSSCFYLRFCLLYKPWQLKVLLVGH